MARIKNVNLMKLGHKDPLWDILITMTTPQTRYYTEAAYNMLRRLRREVAGYKVKKKRFLKANAILLMENGNVLAHNLVLKVYDMPDIILHAFTHKAYRRIGCQKRLLKYTSKHYNALYFWADTHVRKRTFAYYTGRSKRE